MAAGLFPLLVAVLGALIYVFAANNAKLAEMGRLIFFSGFLWCVYVVMGHAAHLLP